MSEYIDREKFISDIKIRYCKPCEDKGKDYKHTKCRACWVDDMIDEIEGAPTAEVVEVKHGKWEYIGTDKQGNVFRCSNCALRIGLDYETTYCPNCGAKMDLEE